MKTRKQVCHFEKTMNYVDPRCRGRIVKTVGRFGQEVYLCEKHKMMHEKGTLKDYILGLVEEFENAGGFNSDEDFGQYTDYYDDVYYNHSHGC